MMTPLMARRQLGERAARTPDAPGARLTRAVLGLLAPVWLRWLLVFNIVVFGWILFRAQSLELAWEFIGQLTVPGDATLWTPAVVAAVVVVVGFQLLPPRPLDALRLRVANLRPATLGLVLAGVAACVGATVPSGGVPPFIYFQF